MDMITLFCDIDDFLRLFEKAMKAKALPPDDDLKKRNRRRRMHTSEVMTLLIDFHHSKYRTFKNYYLKHVRQHLRWAFPNLVSYNRFIELIPETLTPLWTYLRMRFGRCSGISFIDSTPIKVAENQRIANHRVFQAIAGRSKTSTGYFYGFKLHIIINDVGELLAVEVSPGNTDDRTPVRGLTEGLFGKLFADKGYVSQELFDDLFARGLQLVVSIRKNMENKLMPILDERLLKKRMLIETVIDQLKNLYHLEHTRHRSVANFFVNIASALIAYTYQEKKSSLNLHNSQKITDWMAHAF